MKQYLNRTIDPAKPVRVYRNLHRGGYSVTQRGLVVAHTNEVVLKQCKFIISKGGQQRVRQQKRKNVHAFIEGNISLKSEDVDSWDDISYNPYMNDGFVRSKDGKTLMFATEVYLGKRALAYSAF